jgi:hypothetical protein
MLTVGEHVLPSVLEIENIRMGTTTDVRFIGVRVGIDLPDTLFTPQALGGSTKIPGVLGSGERSSITEASTE